jgi:hypothetical protein
MASIFVGASNCFGKTVCLARPTASSPCAAKATFPAHVHILLPLLTTMNAHFYPLVMQAPSRAAETKRQAYRGGKRRQHFFPQGCPSPTIFDVALSRTQAEAEVHRTSNCERGQAFWHMAAEVDKLNTSNYIPAFSPYTYCRLGPETLNWC